MADQYGLEPSWDQSDILENTNFNVDVDDLNAEQFNWEPPSPPPPPTPKTTQPTAQPKTASTGLTFPEPAAEIVQAPTSQYINPQALDNNTFQFTDEELAAFAKSMEQENSYSVTTVNNVSSGEFMYNAYQPSLVAPTQVPVAAPGYPYYPIPPQQQFQPMQTSTYLPQPPLVPVAQPVIATADIIDSRRSSNSLYSDQSEAANANRVPSPEIEHREPLKRTGTGPNGEELKNGRIPRVTRKDQSKPDAREWYGPPPPRPAPWGPMQKNGRPLFQYTEHGELEKGRSYTSTELRWYLYGPMARKGEEFKMPALLPGVSVVHGKKRKGLTLWLSWPASQSNERYPSDSASHKCRFADCPMPNRTIKPGFPRIVLDERMNEDGEAIDPYHNAGYLHLWCFERHFDLVEAWQRLDIRVDDREFRHEEMNPGKLSRQYPEIRNEIDNWWRDEYPKWKNKEGGRRKHRTHETSLTYRLTCHAAENDNSARAKVREGRGGIDITKHKGDLALLTFLKDCKNYDLLDANGDPIPGAEAELEKYMGKPIQPEAQKKAKNGKPNGVSVRRPIVVQQQAPASYIYSHIPSGMYDDPPVAVMAPLHQQGPQPMNPPMPYSYYHEQSVQSPVETAQPSKRSRDEVEAEDQNLGFVYQDQTQEPAAKRHHPEPELIPDTKPEAADVRMVDVADEEYWQNVHVPQNNTEQPVHQYQGEGVASFNFDGSGPGESQDFTNYKAEEPLGDQEAHELIDEMQDGKFSSHDVEENGETHTGPEPVGIDPEQEPVDDLFGDYEINDGEDVFGDLEPIVMNDEQQPVETDTPLDSTAQEATIEGSPASPTLTFPSGAPKSPSSGLNGSRWAA
ncbi:hypothetical protein F5B20DRAFT_479014 [Whalleya microplaca]|nr:hypothetical protein F5B20DRAFT_479014 [Whalleya microplaca]